MPQSDIVIKGAREHNLRDVNLVIPRNQLICLTGVSGSGKSSLAFDTLFAEGQRRYVESLSSFARQFLGQMPKPDVDLISGLSPSISISQKSAGNNPRSTVGTITEISDFLRVLFARVAQGYCPKCDQPIAAQSRDQIIGGIMQIEKGTPLAILAPIIRSQKGEHRELFVDLLKQGFSRVRVDGEIRSLNDEISLERQKRHNIEVVIDRLKVKPDMRARLAESVELGLKLGQGTIVVAVDPPEEGLPGGAAPPRDRIFSSQYACASCGVSFSPPTPQMFSFNSPQGMCLGCDGLGRVFSFDPNLLVPDPSRSFQQGCFELLGNWKDLGRWKRHIYKGVAETVERVHELPPGTMLETAWEELPEELQNIWLFGTGDLHITFTWRGGASPMKYGGTFDGIVPELEEKYRNTKSTPKLRQLEKYMNERDCLYCHGDRLREQARYFRIETASPRFAERALLSLPEINRLSIADAHEFFSKLNLDKTRMIVAAEPVKEIRNRLGFLLNVGLDYLTLDRTAPTLSGGESQRIRLAGQIGAGLVGVMYILDEPSIGLHPRDNDRLIQTLHRLRDLGNTVIVVEHDEDTMRAADHIIDFGPGPGTRGGEVVFEGSPSKIVASGESVTGQFLGGHRRIEIPAVRREPTPGKSLKVLGATHNNLKNVDVEIPLGVFVCVTGVSGSGKSSLVNDILKEVLREKLNNGIGEPGKHRSIEGIEHLDKLIAIDQSPIGRTPRSNPGTYIKLFDEIRKLYSQLPEAKKRGYKPGRFSFNVKGGRCEACEGNGSNRLEMDFLADVWVTCPVCEGNRFNRETLQVEYRERSIADVLEMDIVEAMEFFENIPKVLEKLQTLHAVGLDYLKIGQPSPTLSGGEAQRIKLARELVKKSTGKTLYLLDEPTTGLHFADIQLLLRVLQNFVDAGNTVLVVEHNLDVIKTADWIIDLGPEGGVGGGEIVCTGTPEQVAACKRSKTGQALAKVLERMEAAPETIQPARKKRSKTPKQLTDIVIQGASQHNLRSIDAKIPRDQMSVFCGPSGSGKSSLAMDTIYAEGQRRYVESLSAYARQFVNQLDKPRVEHIEGLSPAIAIEQKNLSNSPRSTVGTITEVYDYLRILFSRLGRGYCPDCDIPIGTQTSDQIVNKLMQYDEGTRLLLLAPIEPAPTQSYEELWDELRQSGFVRVRIDGVTHSIDEVPDLNRRTRHVLEVVVDRITIQSKSRSRIADSVEGALSIGRGVLNVAVVHEELPEMMWEVVRHSQHLACDQCGRSFEALSPHHFSFNSRLGWCPDCEGLGIQEGADPRIVVRDPELTLAQGAIGLWPHVSHELSKRMLEALSAGTGIPLDVPFNQLDARHRKWLFYGTGQRWFDVRDGDRELFSFQFKGIYPTLHEASRLSPTLRHKMLSLIGEVECGACGGSRLRDDAAAVRYRDLTIDGLCRMPLGKLIAEIEGWKLDERESKIAGELLHEITSRVRFLNDVGLAYVTLARTASSLSNGEAQRIRLASQLGSGLCGVLYVLDEPTIGLHPRDNRRLLHALHKLRDLGNTLVVVEHDKEVIENADQVFDFGPRAGAGGGEIVAHGTPAQLPRKRKSVTGPYLNGRKAIPIPANRRPGLDVDPELLEEAEALKSGKTSGSKKPARGKKKSEAAMADRPVSDATIKIHRARHNNLKDIDVEIPLGTLTVVTGPSGCGKSSLIDDVLYRSLARRLHRASTKPGAHKTITGLENINKVIRVDQTPLGNSPTSNPATYTGAFDLIRELFAHLPDSKLRGYTARRFSFNVPGGRCEKCAGNGQICIEMHFLPDVWVRCDDCQGQRYNEETLAVRFNGHNISDVLDMSCARAAEVFQNVPKIRRILQTLCDVGLDYVRLGQAAPTLSGGEAQRVKLAAELARPDTGRTLYLLDEPTTGLHFDDIAKLLEVLQRLVDVGNTVVLIEHNLDVIKAADWVIDMGPEAGLDGGRVVVEGPPEVVVAYANRAQKKNAKVPPSYTGEALAPILAAGPYQERPAYDPGRDDRWKSTDMDIEDVGRNTKMPWEADGRRWHTRDRVGRLGEPVNWDGRILEKVVDTIEQMDGFSETNWNDRSTVEICGTKKSQGWFFHALTGDAWLLKMKFRMRGRTFKQEELEQLVPLRTPNEMDEIPVYGNKSRVRINRVRGGFQEVEFRVHSLEEIDVPGFWEFLERAADSFLERNRRVDLKIDDHTPWAKLGRKWHELPKGFSGKQEIQWDPTRMIDTLCEVIEQVAPDIEFDWSNKVLVHGRLPGQSDPWITFMTKKADALWLQLNCTAEDIPLGRVADLVTEPDVRKRGGKSLVKLNFNSVDQLQNPELVQLLQEHLENETRAVS